jgi:hypothetical protein
MLNKIKTILFPNFTFTIFFFTITGLFFFNIDSSERTPYNIAVIVLHGYLWNLPFHIFTTDENNPGLFSFLKLDKTDELFGNTKIGVFIFFLVWIVLAATAWHYLPVTGL